jgi:AcrR family transcriptional regulator
MDIDTLLDAAETVIARQGIGSLTLDAVAAEAHVSKGGLLHHFSTKDRLVEALVRRCADDWRARYTAAYDETPDGPGRMARALVGMCLGDDELWTEQLRRSSSAVFAALAQNPALIEPMRVVYADLHRRIAADGLPPGVGEAAVMTMDGLWLNWVLGLVPIDAAMKARLQKALAAVLAPPSPARTIHRKTREPAAKRAGGRAR